MALKLWFDEQLHEEKCRTASHGSKIDLFEVEICRNACHTGASWVVFETNPKDSCFDIVCLVFIYRDSTAGKGL